MYNSLIKLVQQVKTVDEYGDMQIQETERPVFAEVKSIGQKEFYEAAAVGLKPEIKFVLADFLDYQGEQQLRYEPFSQAPSVFPGDGLLPGETSPARAKELTYDVIRTYRTGISLEIVCSRGVNEP
ncbi:MAG: hypothetical protein J5546_08945 [Lachnospiraceae bacterium]|nr:hypothetical protein [Lachnospiraceae bacterium]